MARWTGLGAVQHSWSTSWQPWLWLLSLVLIVPAAIALFAGLVHAWLLPGRLTSAALHADSTLGSKDLIRSTLELGSASSVGRETDRPFVGLLLAQAEQLAASVDVRRLVPLVPHHAPARMGWAALIAAAFAAAGVLLPLPSRTGSEALKAALINHEQVRAEVAELSEMLRAYNAANDTGAQDAPSEDVRREVEALEAELRGARDPETLAAARSRAAEAALRASQRMEDDSRRAMHRDEAVREAAARVAQRAQSRSELAKAISAGDLERAAEIARNIGSESSGAPSEQAADKAEELRRLSEAFRQAAREMTARESQPLPPTSQPISTADSQPGESDAAASPPAGRDPGLPPSPPAALTNPPSASEPPQTDQPTPPRQPTQPGGNQDTSLNNDIARTFEDLAESFDAAADELNRAPRSPADAPRPQDVPQDPPTTPAPTPPSSDAALPKDQPTTTDPATQPADPQPPAQPRQQSPQTPGGDQAPPRDGSRNQQQQGAKQETSPAGGQEQSPAQTGTEAAPKPQPTPKTEGGQPSGSPPQPSGAVTDTQSQPQGTAPEQSPGQGAQPQPQSVPAPTPSPAGTPQQQQPLSQQSTGENTPQATPGEGATPTQETIPQPQPSANQQQPAPQAQGQPSPQSQQPGGSQGEQQPTSTPQGFERLAQTLRNAARQGNEAQRSAEESQRLRRQAEKLLDGLSPEQRKEAARELQRIAQSMDPSSPGEAMPKGEGSGGGGGLGPMASPRGRANTPSGRPFDTEPIDLRRPADPSQPPSRVIAEWDAPPTGEGAPAPTGATGLSDGLRSAAQGAERAIEQQAVPPQYSDLVRRVFRRYIERERLDSPPR